MSHKYQCDTPISHKASLNNSLFVCLGCWHAHEEKYNALVRFLKQEIKTRDYVCTTNHAVLLDNAQELLKELGEL